MQQQTATPQQDADRNRYGKTPDEIIAELAADQRANEDRYAGIRAQWVSLLAELDRQFVTPAEKFRALLQRSIKSVSETQPAADGVRLSESERALLVSQYRFLLQRFDEMHQPPTQAAAAEAEQ